MLYVEQPVGVGYSQGTPDITDEDGLAAELVGFFQQFLEVFKEMKGKKFWLSGESVRVVYFMRELELSQRTVCWPICSVFVHIEVRTSSFSLMFFLRHRQLHLRKPFSARPGPSGHLGLRP
jgi:hypothetical protein